MNQITLSNNDYRILKEVYAVGSAVVKSKLIDLSVWQMADMIESELQPKDIPRYSTKHKCVAIQGDVVYINSGSSSMGDEYIGHYYKVHTRFSDDTGVEYSAIRAIDTFSNQGNEYLVLLDDEQYLTLK